MRPRKLTAALLIAEIGALREQLERDGVGEVDAVFFVDGEGEQEEIEARVVEAKERRAGRLILPENGRLKKRAPDPQP